MVAIAYGNYQNAWIGKLVDHGRKTVFGHGYSCHVCLLRPKSRGQLTLASKDPLAAPRIDPNFLGDGDDARRMVSGFKLMREILRQPAMDGLGGRELASSANARSDAEIEAFIRAHADTIYHPVGTCRMGTDEAEDRKGYLIRTNPGWKDRLTENPMTQPDGWRMIRRRAKQAGIKTLVGCHSFRATGITVYLENGGTLERAQQMANHESPKTTKLYDRTQDQITLDEVERIAI